MKRKNIKDKDLKFNKINVNPLDKRESKMDLRKGIRPCKPKGLYDATDYKEQLLFDL